MPNQCPECGAPVPDSGSCRDNFHALLLLEAEVPGGPGGIPHFHAVSSYALQHPNSMGYTEAALNFLRADVANQLNGRASLADIRRRTRARWDGAARVLRRTGDVAVKWQVLSWPMTVADILAGGVEGYGERVAAWASSVRRTLDEAVGKLQTQK